MKDDDLREYAKRALDLASLSEEFPDTHPGKMTPEEQHCHDCEMEIFRQWLAELDPESWRCPVMLPNAYGKERCGRKKGHEGKCCYERMD